MTRRFSVFILITLLAPSLASAEPPQPPNPADLLARANAAAAKLQAVAYEGEFFADGALATRIPKMTGKVIAQRAKKGDEHSVIAAGSAVMPGDGTLAEFLFVSDGERVYSVDHRRKVFTTGVLAEIGGQVSHPLFQPRYLHDSPFAEEINASKLSYLGVEVVADVPCDVVLAETGGARPSTLKLFLGKDDALLRRCETTARPGDPTGQAGMSSRITFTVKNLIPNPEIAKDAFRPRCPDGYENKPFEARKPQQRDASGLLSVGQTAPIWELETTDGKTITLESLRGNVVVMDFWATWCGPCRMAMPGLQKLHERFKGQPVKVFGVNCRERSRNADPAAFAKSLGLTYTQLLNGNAVAGAYGVRGIPCLYVIGKDGKILRAVAGFSPRMEAELGALIEQHTGPQQK
ncbi:MAG: redoxin domain-containing protein [Planctomycetota bacterium]